MHACVVISAACMCYLCWSQVYLNYSHSQAFFFWLFLNVSPSALSGFLSVSSFSPLFVCFCLSLSLHIDLNTMPTDHGHVDTPMTLDFSWCTPHKGALCPDQTWTGHAIRGTRRQPDQTGHQGIFPSSTATAVSFNLVKYMVYDAGYNLCILMYLYK